MKRKDLKPGTVFQYSTWNYPLCVEYAGLGYRGATPPQSRCDSRQVDLWNDDVAVLFDPDVPLAPVTQAAPAAKPAILTTDKAARKEMPIARGVIDYFPRALAAVAHVSFVANEQHNPGQPMHWSKGKSADHADCIARHLIERGAIDDDGLAHSAKLAWRALALLETDLEAAQ